MDSPLALNKKEQDHNGDISAKNENEISEAAMPVTDGGYCDIPENETTEVDKKS